MCALLCAAAAAPAFPDDFENEFLANSVQVQYLYSDGYDIGQGQALLARLSRYIAPRLNFQVQYLRNPRDTYALSFVYTLWDDLLVFSSLGAEMPTVKTANPSYALGVVRRFSANTTMNLSCQYTNVPGNAMTTGFIKLRQVVTPVTLLQLRHYTSVDAAKAMSHFSEFRINQYIAAGTAVHFIYSFTVDAEEYGIDTFTLNLLKDVGAGFLVKLGYAYQQDSKSIVSYSPRVLVSYQVSKQLGTYIAFRTYTESDGTSGSDMGSGVQFSF